MTVRPPRHWETSRLLARPAVEADAQAVFDVYARDPRVARYMTWTPHHSPDETRGFLARSEREWRDGHSFLWTLWRKPEASFAGVLEARLTTNGVALGYGLDARLWRQGLMGEAVTTVVAWALAQPSIHRVWATCDVENVASARLLERVGMQREGVLRRWLVHPNLGDTPRDCYCYAVVR